jgi:hypothetical protein
VNTETYVHLALTWFWNSNPKARGLRFADLADEGKQAVLRQARTLQMDDDRVRLHTLYKRTVVEVI